MSERDKEVSIHFFGRLERRLSLRYKKRIVNFNRIKEWINRTNDFN